jgi:hypothetical protein
VIDEAVDDETGLQAAGNGRRRQRTVTNLDRYRFQRHAETFGRKLR